VDPCRNWKIRVVAVDNNREKKGKLNHLLEHVEYWLHPTFENPVRGTATSKCHVGEGQMLISKL